ncbi:MULTISPECIES: polymorphic toxin type 15 domain-containing protein [Bacillus cereus group]|uniref:polymorphic toxin type 15 domain-containing protein n=1 Tax=Bacillus cereus group TaxID=86661 RepID=UPI0025422176|nr:polymorphic toxin type 15 domain-containing protein [Bacillus anthracis]WIG24052.1 polymorphic toxin type 15 domain-containing protein [Bacillus anthracis]
MNFNRNVKHDSEEFARQLKDQEKGMNELTVDEYLKNRERYIAQGRAIEGNAAQQAAREEAYVQKVNELQREGLTLSNAKKKAKEWLDTQAALHNPDQIAGGKAEIIGGMGDKRINSSIGSQWRYRIDIVDEQIKGLARNMTPEQLKSTYLNVKLTH